MTPRSGKQFRTSPPTDDLTVQRRHAAGIDIHAAVDFVAVAPEDVPAGFVNPQPRLPPGVRKFGTTTGELEALAAWLKDCHVTTVAMEATGVYWIALYDLLASQGFEVFLVDPRQTKHAPGRPKSDVLDCQWIRRLHSYGLLTASFRPGDAIVRWRGFVRQREMLIRYAAQHVQHLQKILEEMNVKLTEVVSDIVGQTGLSIIKDIVRGQRDPQQLAKPSTATRRARPAKQRSPARCTATGGASICLPCGKPCSCTSFTRGNCASARPRSKRACAAWKTRAPASRCRRRAVGDASRRRMRCILAHGSCCSRRRGWT